MSDSPQPHDNILQLIGAIVLSAQQVEQTLKAILPFTDSQDPSFSGVKARNKKLKMRTLGDLIGKFLDSSTFHTVDFDSQMEVLVNTRNQIVHHFGETYGAQLGSGETQQVADSLRAQLADIEQFKKALQHVALHLFEAIRDTAFYGTPEYQDMATFCASFRRRVAS